MTAYNNRRNNPRYSWPAAPKPGPFYRKETAMSHTVCLSPQNCYCSCGPCCEERSRRGYPPVAGSGIHHPDTHAKEAS